MEQVRSGLLRESALDSALRHALGLRFELGLFDPIDSQPYWHVPPAVVASEAHVAAALDATRQGLVLLQNPSKPVEASPARRSPSKLLPLAAGRRLAVVGPHANGRSALLVRTQGLQPWTSVL